MKNKIMESELKLTIADCKKELPKHYGMYCHYMTEDSSLEDFDYEQWSKTTIVNKDFIDSLDKIDGLIKVSVWFHEPLFSCDIIPDESPVQFIGESFSIHTL